MWRTAVLAGGDAFTHHWIRGGHNASWRRGLRCEAHVLHESLHALLRCSLRACMSHMFSCSCVRPSFVGETISGGSCRHLLPRFHPRSPPRRRVVATSGHQTPTRTRMPSRVDMACGQLSSTSRAPSLTDALVSTRRHALVASALSHPHPKHLGRPRLHVRTQESSTAQYFSARGS